jgi:hypothetical protein
MNAASMTIFMMDSSIVKTVQLRATRAAGRRRWGRAGWRSIRQPASRDP